MRSSLNKNIINIIITVRRLLRFLMHSCKYYFIISLSGTTVELPGEPPAPEPPDCEPPHPEPPDCDPPDPKPPDCEPSDPELPDPLPPVPVLLDPEPPDPELPNPEPPDPNRLVLIHQTMCCLNQSHQIPCRLF